jgi:hypothetical protein
VRGRGVLILFVAAALALPASAQAGHLLNKFDHSPPTFVPQTPPSTAFQGGGKDAKWEFVTTLPDGNPHTDLDFFTQGGNIYASVGTLAIGPNGGGQSIFQLTEGDKVAPKFLTSEPTASCISEPSQALGLQHDVEATPKGNAILNTDVLAANRTDTQLLIDATDNPGRCHDQGVLGIEQAPQGGLEIIDVTDVNNPVTIGLTSHIGEAHTVNIDPKRPQIAYAVTSDAVGVNDQGVRGNEDPAPGNADRLDLDGFEVVDLSSCMNFPPGTSLEQKRASCRPQVFRYRYPNTDISLGHTLKTGANAIFGCHELEIYPNDHLMCAGGNAMIGFDMSGAFDDNGTPANFNDDHPRGTPLPCSVRDSSSTAGFTTGAKVVDCVRDGPAAGDEALNVPNWLAAGAPSLTGVQWLGSAFHQGRGAGGAASPAFDSTQDIDFDHEAELTHSGNFVIASDERGGGVTPPGASCSPSVDNKAGNGGLHAYRVDRLLTRRPADANDAFSSYAHDPKGGKAIVRIPIRTQPQDSLCTAHVFQQIPGQNRIFMGWYSQGTHVLDYEERPDGSFEWREAAFFIPTQADEWVSHIFKVQRNPDDSFTYWGAAADFNLGNAGRNTVDIYKVTLPPPPTPASLQEGVGRGFDARLCVPSSARVTRSRIGPARIRRSGKTFKRKYKSGRRKGRVIRYCLRDRARGRFYVGSTRKGKIEFVATTARRHGTKKYRPGKRVGARGIPGTRRLARGVFIGRGRKSRAVYGVRRGRVRFVAVVSRSQAKRPRALVRRLRALSLAPKR